MKYPANIKTEIVVNGLTAKTAANKVAEHFGADAKLSYCEGYGDAWMVTMPDTRAWEHIWIFADENTSPFPEDGLGLRVQVPECRTTNDLEAVQEVLQFLGRLALKPLPAN